MFLFDIIIYNIIARDLQKPITGVISQLGRDVGIRFMMLYLCFRILFQSY